jgi:hypothetical protein
MKLEVWRHRYRKEIRDGFGWRRVEFRMSSEGQAIAGGHFIEWRSPSLGLR